MKVAFFSQPAEFMSPSEPNSSIEIWTYEVARRLSRFCDVTVYSTKSHGQKNIESHEGVKYRRISATSDQKFLRFASFVDKRLVWYGKFRRPLFASSLYHHTYAMQVAKAIKEDKCDLVHISNFSQYVPIIRALNPKIRIALNMHCEWLTQLDRRMIESRLKDTDLILSCSQYIDEKIQSFFPQFAKHCHTIYDGVDLNRFTCEKHKTTVENKSVKRVLFVGRISPEKGLHILLEAFQKVVKRFPQARLEVVGPKSLLPMEFLVALHDNVKVLDLSRFYLRNRRQSYLCYLQKQLNELDIAKNVTFSGSVPYSRVPYKYCRADLFVNSSFSEALGMPILEAMASGLPAVGTRVGGIPEAISHGKTGLLVDQGDPLALAEAMISLLQDQDLSRSMGKAARERAVRLFSWDKTVRDLSLLYRNSVEGND